MRKFFLVKKEERKKERRGSKNLPATLTGRGHVYLYELGCSAKRFSSHISKIILSSAPNFLVELFSSEKGDSNFGFEA